MGELRYPEGRSPFLAALPERHRRFAELREEFLLGYCYNTARAYWSDLEDLFDWSKAQDLDILELSEDDMKRYAAGMREMGYSASTIRRRGTAIRGLTVTLNLLEKTHEAR